MAKLLANIYVDYLSEEKHYIEHFKKFDAKISEIVKPAYDDIKNVTAEDMRIMVCNAASQAELYGFYLGIHTALRMMNEINNALFKD